MLHCKTALSADWLISILLTLSKLIMILAGDMFVILVFSKKIGFRLNLLNRR